MQNTNTHPQAVPAVDVGSSALLGDYEHAIIAIRDRAARLANEAETEAVLKPAREIIIECERVLERHNQALTSGYTRRCDACSPCFDCWDNPRRCRKPGNNPPEPHSPNVAVSHTGHHPKPTE